jgi:predicted nucleic acid-binding protein
MKYLLDTNILIDYFYRSQEYLNIREIIARQNFLIFPVILELGSVLPKLKNKEHQKIDSKFASIAIDLLLSLENFEIIPYKIHLIKALDLMKKQENELSLTDSLLLVTAKIHNLTLLTRDQEILKLANKYPVKNPYLKNI